MIEVPVIYHGSIAEAHGPAVLVAECACGFCQEDTSLFRWILALPSGGELHHVRAESFEEVRS